VSDQEVHVWSRRWNRCSANRKFVRLLSDWVHGHLDESGIPIEIYVSQSNRHPMTV
jgi:hypothetical protein